MMKISNPAFKSSAFTDARTSYGDEVMTIGGAINRSLFLLLLLVMSSAAVWMYLQTFQRFETVAVFVVVSMIATVVLGFVAIFMPRTTAVTAPLYAVFEGFALGSVSMLADQLYPGVALQAVALTIGIMAAMLLAYKSGLIKVTAKFRAFVVVATIGIMLTYFVSWVLGMFHIQIPLFAGGTWGIVFSLVVIGVAALNLLLNFDNIVQAAEQGSPKYMEWYCAFGLMLTLIWLYWEILRLLMLLSGRDD